MPLTPLEQVTRIGRFAGQRGRGPVASLGVGDASHSDGAFHNSDFLTPARGTAKLTAAPVPGSAYELRGLATGILEFPAVEGYDAAWISSPGTQRSWCCRFALKALRIGDLIDAASGDGQVFFATATQVGTNPTGGAAIDAIRASLVLSGGTYTVRVKWGIDSFDVPLVGGGSVPFDPSDWMGFSFSCLNGDPTATLRMDVSQATGAATYMTLATPLVKTLAKGWLVHQFWIGGALPDRRPVQGVYRPCPCVVTQVEVTASTNDNSAPAAPYATPWSRTSTVYPPLATSTKFRDIWELRDDSSEPVSVSGHKARLVGNRVHRSGGVTPQQQGSIDFDGSGMLTIQEAERFRETPKTRAQGGVEGHYLELPELTLALCVDPRRIPWRHASVERACILCWSTPLAQNLGVSSDPVVYSSNVRPSEHLRCEIERIGGAWYLRAYFGELEPESLKHPGGTVGGSTSTAWPPALSTAGEPPATWNKPLGDPTASYAAANGKTAFQIQLGLDSDATHPMDYAWWIFLQRRFVAQGSSSNDIGVFVRRVKPDGTLDSAFGEARDVNADGSGERHPANQSCFAATRLSGNDINFRPDSYVLTLGGAGGSMLGDERRSYDGASTVLPLMYPVDDAVSRCQFSDEGDAYPAIVRVASFVALKRYLLLKDRQNIAKVGIFGSDLRLQFADDYLASYNFEEDAGNVLRDGRGDDLSYAERIGLAAIASQDGVEQPQSVGAFPRPEPPWHNEVDRFAGEFSEITGIAQRFATGEVEEIYATALPGLYEYDRGTHALTRLATLPGQGGPGQQSLVVDTNDILHCAGGKGRPVVLTRDKVLAISGIDAPFYSAPVAIITQKKVIVGGLTIDFQVQRNTNINLLIGYEIDDTAAVQFAIGYWSDALKARSRPGPVVTARYVDSQAIPPTSLSATNLVKYRLLVSGLPPPRGPNASLVTHWEIYRTDSNGSQLILERRVPISQTPVAIMVGDIPLGTAEAADVFRDVPPEGMKAIVPFGDRMVGIAPPELPRSIVWTKRRDPMNWPPIYLANLNQTSAPAAGCIIRRGRAFPFSRDHLYQLIESTLDADLQVGAVESLSVDTLADGVGGLSHQAAITDHDNGIYLPGNKTVYLTEGGTYRSVSLDNDAAGTGGGDDFAWPDSWDLSDPGRFVSFHDERRRMIAICGPSADDPERIDAMCIFYERAAIASDGRSVIEQPDATRLKGIDVNCVGEILNPATGAREVWFGTRFGYLARFGEFGSVGADYDWLPKIAPKYGYVIDVPSSTQLLIEASISSYGATDVFRGCVIRVYRDGEMLAQLHVASVVAEASWATLTLDGEHGAAPGDEWSIGAIPLDYRSGKIDHGDTVTDKRLHQAELAMNE